MDEWLDYNLYQGNVWYLNMPFLKTKISPLQNLKIEKSSDSARQKIIALHGGGG